MRISDWSSDVCSSDLVRDRQDPGPLTGVFALNSYLRGMTAAAGAEVKTVLRRTAIRAGLLVFAFLLLAIALQAVAVSAYLALDRHFSNAAAALLTAIGLLILAGIVAAVAMSLRRRPARP